KTGTLTQRRMAATHIAYADAEHAVDALASDAAAAVDAALQLKHGRVRRTMTSLRHLPVAARHVFETALLCNDARFDALTAHMPVHERIAVGDATDCALLRMAETLFPTREALPAYRTLLTIPFSTRSRWMLSVCDNQLDDDAGPFMVVKGAPERLLPKCTAIQDSNGRMVPLDAVGRRRLEDMQLRWASAYGCRVLLLCRRDFASSPFVGIEDSPAQLLAAASSHMRCLCVVALVGMVDPPRIETQSTIDALRGAGIRVFMATGDYAPTAAFVARQCHIITSDSTDGLDAVLLACADDDGDNNEDNADPRHPEAKEPAGSLRLLTKERDSEGSQQTLTNRNALVISGPELHELQQSHWDA
ncbi:hypothetical protein GGI22_007900, partial [Coemansia erecta]